MSQNDTVTCAAADGDDDPRVSRVIVTGVSARVIVTGVSGVIVTGVSGVVVTVSS